MTTQPAQSSVLPQKVQDERWQRALIGLRAIGWPLANKAHRRGEITGVEEYYVWIVFDGDEEPTKLFWTNVRPA